MKRFSSRRHLPSLLFGFGVSGIFVFLLLQSLDIDAAGSIVRSLSPSGLLAAAAFLGAGYTLRVIRWWWILRELNPALRLSKCFGPFLASFALNNLLPFRAGDLLRCLAFRKHLQAAPMGIFGSVVLERMFDLMTVVVLLIIGHRSVVGSEPLDAFVRHGVWMGPIGLLVSWWAWRAASSLRTKMSRLAESLALREVGWPARLARATQHFAEAFTLLRSPAMILQVTILSAGVWLLEGGVFVSVAQALAVDMPMAASFYALGLGTLATLLPSTPGALGTFDYGTMQGAIDSGVDQDTAVVFAVAVHLVLWAPVSSVGLMFLGISPVWEREYRDLPSAADRRDPRHAD